MKKHKYQEPNIGLRSEKVRNIVGQIPSSLVRFGSLAICGILLCLFTIAYFLPYKRIYIGTTIVHKVKSKIEADYAEIIILLKFDNQQPSKLSKLPIYLEAPQGTIVGEIIELSPIRDTLNRREAICVFKEIELKNIENQSLDFQIIESKGTLLQQLLTIIFD
ncbi:MAG: hypothetical protein IKI67_04335 [Bacteroidales bacterium]|nr:hypothetical protein [Bacteroidales bacterium]